MTANAKGRHLRALTELARGGLEPSDPTVQQKHNDFRSEVTEQALKILKERIPAKILYFNDQVNVTAAPGETLHTRDLTRFARPASLSAQPMPVPSAPQPIRKETKRLRVEPMMAVGAPPPQIPLCEQIVAMGEKVRREAFELIEMVGVVRLWIQLNVPRIEDGNNFGVAIQEEAIQELGRVEDAAFNLCDGTKYHTARAKLVSKMVKYPTIDDYVQAIVEADRKEWIDLKVSLIDMRNSYSLLYDLLHKNWEKVVKPRGVEGGGIMVM